MKRKIAILLLCLISVFSLVGCENRETSGFEEDGYGNSIESMFVIVERQENFEIVYHKATKVMYSISRGHYNYGTFTLLVDENGKPLLWQGEL